MNHNTPLSPHPLRPPADGRRLVLTARQLREHRVGAATAAERCRPGGPWQQILPGVYLLHPGPPTSEERLHAALLYAGRPAPGRAVPEQPGPENRVPSAPERMPEREPGPAPDRTRGCLSDGPDGPDGPTGAPGSGSGTGSGEPFGSAVITGEAALALHCLPSAPPLISLDRFDVLVPRSRRVRSTGHVRIVRTARLPRPLEITGVPVAPLPRALADAAARLTDAAGVRGLLTEAVRAGCCEAGALVRELSRARLLTRPHVMEAADALLAQGRAVAEGRLYAMVREHRLPEPLWNVDLRLPGGPGFGRVDAYWPEQAVALRIDHGRPDDGALPAGAPREQFERYGLTLVGAAPGRLRDAPDEQATVVRTALMAAPDCEPPAPVVALPH
ncbi:hypothetical protein [Streptomyces lycii]|uniref:Transcriptional regulator, AbiEi antitoxin, Type IV TA system n=1 Tax=Streptomyces lycii TaxID=2654337 RepID=A0ABQ7FEB0_9ACTN|nr:hypothetical protein [Streptomyces lycii]KAF4406009.1 hypothetical protein GCU69_27455 [Streptomyces lycii]